MNGSDIAGGAAAGASLADVCLAVSSFRNDEAVLRILESVYAGARTPFSRVIVVDSLGTGVVPRVASERGWDRLDYYSFSENAGSAGNLAKRLELAAKSDAAYVYAINHDGHVDPTVVSRLREAARDRPAIGAVFPLRSLTNQRGRYDVTGRFPVPLFAIRSSKRPTESTIPVYWNSSNGALYNLEPVRRGLLPWSDLWMGWEDLGYGWTLRRNGYQQLVVVDAVAEDPYEYDRKAGMWVTGKAPWYSYYYARNFLVVGRRSRQPLPIRALMFGRVASEFLVSAILRDNKRERLSYLFQGLRDGYRGRMGKWSLP